MLAGGAECRRSLGNSSRSGTLRHTSPTPGGARRPGLSCAQRVSPGAPRSPVAERGQQRTPTLSPAPADNSRGQHRLRTRVWSSVQAPATMPPGPSTMPVGQCGPSVILEATTMTSPEERRFARSERRFSGHGPQTSSSCSGELARNTNSPLPGTLRGGALQGRRGLLRGEDHCFRARSSHTPPQRGAVRKSAERCGRIAQV